MTERPDDPRPDQIDDDDPVLPQTTSDESDVGWGDDPESRERDEQWYQRERPPHHE